MRAHRHDVNRHQAHRRQALGAATALAALLIGGCGTELVAPSSAEAATTGAPARATPPSLAAGPAAPPPAATTAPAFHLVAVGDIARSGGAQDRTAAVTARLDPRALLLMGDIAYSSGTEAEFARYFAPHYSRFAAISWPIPGNHEYRTSDAAGYRAYFGVTGATWWAKRAGSWLVIGLDSERVSSPTQRAWLVATLKANNGTPTLVTWHRPRFSSGEHGDQPDVAPLWRLVAPDRDVKLVLWGHDHDYERMQKHVSGRASTISAFVVGTGGAELRGLTRHRGRTWVKRAIAGRYGVLDLQLRATSFSWRFVRGNGTAVDAGSRSIA